MTYTIFRKANNSEPERHYNVRFPKFLPDKVMINGRLRDRASLTAEEHRAVQAQEAIERARAVLKQSK